MKLFYRSFGSGSPLLILHGLFGQSDNWNTLAKQFASEGLQVFTADLRNHGLSPHSGEWSYAAMTEDILELINDLNLSQLSVLGHSMGGRVAMQFAIRYPERIHKLIIADMAPKTYPSHHDQIVKGLLSADLTLLKTRKEVDARLSEYISDEATKQFLLKNLYWIQEDRLGWRFNLPVIASRLSEVSSPFPVPDQPCTVPAWFIRGGRSGYVTEADMPLIQTIFPKAVLVTIPDAGHWIHAEQPRIFKEEVIRILA
ncbi:MAG TPA: alpha/beta fold hydrolase [Bacteroidia bacterium]|jgi:esterase|nr:alpha/beta fold hydrolase [Bacteroidia bacterium]